MENEPLTQTSTLEELVSLWQRRRAEGQTVMPTDLCRNHPELLKEMERRVAALERMDALAGAVQESGATLDAADSPQTLNSGPDFWPQIPGYTVLGELGRGGMGVVYKARQLGLNRIVALKMSLRADYASAEDRRRFQAEAEAIARIQYRNIVQIYEIGEYNGKAFFSLEYCSGGSLDRRLAGTPLPSIEAARLVQTLARAVQVAHQHNVIHRDLKPSNILLTGEPNAPLANGEPKITDFGLARKIDEPGQTASGTVLGTPSYMAPEQASGMWKDSAPACDVYALGAILYESLTGRPPFKAATALDTIRQVQEQEPVAPSRLQGKMPRDLETICMKCLEKEPRRRYVSALELAEDLRRFEAGEPIQARPVGVLERTWRWCRRNRSLAASLASVLFSLLAATLVSLLFALRAEEARQGEATQARSEAAAKDEARQAQRDALRQLIDLSGASGLNAAREGDRALALLWFTKAVHLAQKEPDWQELNRIRAANWLRQVGLPEGTFTVANFRQHQDRFRIFQFSPDGKYLLIAAGPGGFFVWDCRQGQRVSLPDGTPKGRAAAWEPKTGLLAVAGEGERIQLLSPPTFQPVEVVTAAGEVSLLTFSGDGQRLAWGGAGGARVWDRERKEYLTPFLVHPKPVMTLSFSASGQLLATSAGDFKARVFRMGSETGEPLFPPVPHTRQEHGLAHGGADRVAPRFAANDTVLLTVENTAEHNHRLAWRSATSGKVLMSNSASGGGKESTASRTYRSGALPITSNPPSGQGFLTAFAVSPRGDQVAVMWEDDGQLWDARKRQPLATVALGARYNWCEDVVFAADGKTLITCGHNMRAQFWSVENPTKGFLTASYPPILHPMKAVRTILSADGKHLAAALWDGTVYQWRMPEGLSPAYAAAAGGTTLPVVSPDGRFVLPGGTTYRNGTQLLTRVYQADSGKAAGPLLDPGGILLNSVFSPDGVRVATASSTGRTVGERDRRLFAPEGKGGNIQIWDWKTAKRLTGPIPTPSEPRGLAFHPSGRILAAVCADYRVVLIDPDTGAITHNLDPGVRTAPFNANLYWGNGEARFSPDGRFLVTWELATPVHVWEPNRGLLLHKLPHDERVECVAFSPVAPEILATVGRDSVARVWDLTTGKRLARLPHPVQLSRVQFSPDGTELITSCADGMLRDWDWRKGKLIDARELHASALADFGFTADRRWLVTLGQEDLQVTDWRSKTPAGPLWPLGKNIHLALAIPTGADRVIVGGFSRSLEAYDLKAMTAPLSGAAEELLSFAELAASRRILTQGAVVPLSSSEWAERWRRQHGRWGRLERLPSEE